VAPAALQQLIACPQLLVVLQLVGSHVELGVQQAAAKQNAGSTQTSHVSPEAPQAALSVPG